MATAVLWIFAASVGLVFPWIKNAFSIVTAFDVFLIVSVLGLLFDIFLLKETKGKTQRENWKDMGVKLDKKKRERVDPETTDFEVSDPETVGLH